MRVTLNKLVELTSKDRRTILKRIASLAPDASNTYDSAEALRLIFNPDLLDPNQERAKLDAERREITEIKKRILLRELIPADAVQTHWSNMVANTRAKLLNLPSRLAAVSVGVPTIQEAERHATDLIHEALLELSGNGKPEAN